MISGGSGTPPCRLSTDTGATSRSAGSAAVSAGGTLGRIADLGGLAFQIGLFGLLTVQSRTGATGTSRTSVIMLRIEAVLLALASVWSLLHAILPEAAGDGVLLGVLDLFWPLSMFGMFVISVKLLPARRWRGVLRWWPLVAESWAVVTVPAYVLLGGGAPRWVGGGHLFVGYTMLGLLLALRPEDVLPEGEAGGSGPLDPDGGFDPGSADRSRWGRERNPC
ncbi:hypothetical protein [Microbispora catharanthi]|uniref:Uncharacterized protein n=1 Tax=Microbispora catharanthi TaxID=1712871 RepID=A0A5N6C4J1_9ACTN|nr:hypothetical protein [Microbispora catharanthi]KAB8187638.1 hypothetical protein FH610_000185 [Microbispora catharanthi]